MDSILIQIVWFVVLAGSIGILAHVIGEALPRDAFDYTRFPYASYAWEQEGRFYNRLHIERWKNHLPDKSRVVKTTVEKSIRGDCTPEHFLRLVQETCVAELVHWVLLFISPLLLIVLNQPFGIGLTVLYGLSNIPFIMIQRYNRPRLVRMFERLVEKSGGSLVPASGAVRATTGKRCSKGDVTHETADSILQ